jgi:putative component of toxin-antitoxin plasmid stabilization module
MNTLIRTATQIYLLLVGGDKATQKRDIKTAREMARNLKE